MPKYVEVLVLVMNCVAYVGEYTDCKNTHGADSIKCAIAQPAKSVCNYKNTKEKLYKTNLANVT